MKRLEGRVALVTGAASGISRATALRFASEGAKVALLDTNEAGVQETAAEIVSNGSSAFPVIVDVTSSEAVQRAVRQVVDHWGSIRVVFNGVGVSGRRWGDGPVHECTEEAWERVLSINLTSMFLMCKYVVQDMLNGGVGGSIVNLASVLGLVGGDADFATHAYAASKSGIIGLSRSMAAYYAPHNIRVNIIAPGLIATPMSQRAQNNPHILERLRDLQPLTGAMGLPEDVAGAAAFLASDDARFVTGAVLTVDGGWTVH